MRSIGYREVLGKGKVMRFALFVAILFLCIVIGMIGAEVDTSAYEQPRPASNIASCDVWAYVIHQDPKGLKVEIRDAS